MIKHKLVACLVSGLLFISTAFPQVKVNGTAPQQKASEQCAPDANEYEAARTSYLDCAERLNNLRVQLSFYKKQYDELFDQCAHANDQLKSKLACEQLGLLSSGRYSIMQQEYINAAQTGCAAPPQPPVRQVAGNCAAGTGTAASNSNSPGQPSTMKGSAKAASNPPGTHLAPVQQAGTTGRPHSTVQPRMQPMPAAAPNRTSGDASRQSFSGNSPGGPSPTAGSNVSTAGAGRVK